MRGHFLRAAAGRRGGDELTGYTFEVTTTAPNTVFTLRTTDAVNYDVDWGDGDSDTGVTSNAWPHTYAAAGTYTVTVESVAPFRFYANDVAPDDELITAIIGASDHFPWGGSFPNGAWYGCSNLTDFPLLDVSSVTNFGRAWQNCSGLTSFPPLDVSSGTNFLRCWLYCSSLTSFPLLDVSNGTNFNSAWQYCSSLTSFPLLDVSNGTRFVGAWLNCSGLTSFPLLNVSSGTDFGDAWRHCSSLTDFPLLDVSSGTNFSYAWYACSSLTDFPAGFFDSWTGTPEDSCFGGAWDNCTSLSATSVENILNSIDTSGQSAPASGVDITIDYNASSGTPNIAQAVANLTSRGWTIKLNGVAQ